MWHKISSVIRCATLCTALLYTNKTQGQTITHDQKPTLQYGITDYEIDLNSDQDIVLVIKLDEGIDSIIHNIDTAIFDVEKSLMTTFLSKEQQSKTKTFNYIPKVKGQYNFDGIEVWSKGKMYKLNFPRTVIIRPENLESKLKEGPSSYEIKNRIFEMNNEVFSDSISQGKIDYNIWFDKKVYSINEKITLRVMTNKNMTQVIIGIKDGDFKELGMNISKNTKMFDDKIEESFTITYRLKPTRKGKLFTNRMKLVIGNQEIIVPPAQCIVK